MSDSASPRRSLIWLVLGAVLTLVSTGRWVIPLAAWLAPIFLLRFTRSRRPLAGYVLLWVATAIAGTIAWWGVLPFPSQWCSSR